MSRDEKRVAPTETLLKHQQIITEVIMEAK